MSDFLDVLARDAKETIKEGYYGKLPLIATSHVSLRRAILESKAFPIITEIKAASPSLGTIRENVRIEEIAEAMKEGGAVGISVLTEPKHFKGSLRALAETRRAVKLPILMKDIVISPVQLEAASKLGADAVLLIEALFDRGYCECDAQKMIAKVHLQGLEVLLETHDEDEFRRAVRSDADLIGINNRDLGTFEVDLRVTESILERNDTKGKIVVSESGISLPADLHFLRRCGARAFLIGSAIMSADNVKEKVEELVLKSGR